MVERLEGIHFSDLGAISLKRVAEISLRYGTFMPPPAATTDTGAPTVSVRRRSPSGRQKIMHTDLEVGAIKHPI